MVRRPIVVFAHDLIVTGLAFVFSLWLRVGGDRLSEYIEAIQAGLPILLVVSAVVYWRCGLYRGVWRYASVHDLLTLMRAATYTVTILIVQMFLLNQLGPVPRSVPLILWFVLIVFMGGPRMAYRLIKDRRDLSWLSRRGDARVPVLIIGADTNAEIFIRSLMADKNSMFRALGVLDRGPTRVGRMIHNVPVLGRIDEMEEVVDRLKHQGAAPQRVVIASPPHVMRGDTIRDLLDRCSSLGLTLSRLPSLTNFETPSADGRLDLRPIALEDLLGRPQVRLDRSPVSNLIRGQVILVTGAGGSIGGELCRQIASDQPARLVLVDHGEFNLYSISRQLAGKHPGTEVVSVLCDVRDRAEISRVMVRYSPDLVFHAAALKHVPLVEANPREGAATNVLGTRNVAEAALAARARGMVLISSDKAVSPSSVMGATKRVAEAYCQALDSKAARRTDATRFVVVRFGNVLGSSGSVVPLFQEQLASGGPLTVTHPEMRRYFMTISEAVQLVLQASACGVVSPRFGGRIFVLDMGEPVRVADLARQMIRLAGLRPDQDIRIVFTGQRPGEKLTEELFHAGEETVAAPVDGVLVASPCPLDTNQIASGLARLEQAVNAGDAKLVLAALCALVPDSSVVASDCVSVQ